MKTFKKASLVLGVVGILECCLLAAPSMGATMFSESFDGADGTTSFGPNFTLPGSPGNYQIQSNQAANPSVDFWTDANRVYVRTVDSDYSSVDFVAEITMTRTNDTAAGAYFGIGDATPDTGSYYLPDNALYLEAFPYYGPLTRFNENPAGSGGNVDAQFGSDNTTMPKLTTSRLRMTKTGNNLQFQVDVDSSTFVTADIASSVIDLTAYPGMPGHIFFGGGQYITFDDFTVSAPIPEPSGLALLLCGSVLLPMFRRKRRA